MWVLIAGNLLCLFISTLLYKILNIKTLKFLYSTEKILGWFLVEFIPETYCNSSVKLFLINEEFRQLITNFLLVFKNIISLSYLITSVEYINLVITELFLMFLLMLHINFLLNNVKKVKKKGIFYFLIIIGLTIKLFINLKTYSLKFFSIPFLFALNYLVNGLLIQNSSLFVVLIFIYYITYKNYMYYKINGFFLQICIIVFLIYFLFNIEILCNNNFLNELCLKQLYLYIIILFNI